MLNGAQPAANGMTASEAATGTNTRNGAIRKTRDVGLVRRDVLLEHELDRVGERLQQPERARLLRPEPHLDPRRDLALRTTRR